MEGGLGNNNMRTECTAKYSKQLHVLVVIGKIKTIKEIEHRKLGWKVLILKYDLGKSLSREMWCKMADTKQCFDYIF